MRVKALRTFGYKRLYATGQTFNLTKEDLEKINSGPHGQLVEVIGEPDIPEEPKERPLKKKDYEAMTKKEIMEKAEATDIELDMRMTKAEMIKALGV